MTLETIAIDPAHVRGVSPDVAASALYESVYGATELLVQLQAAGRLRADLNVPNARAAVARLAVDILTRSWTERGERASQAVPSRTSD